VVAPDRSVGLLAGLGSTVSANLGLLNQTMTTVAPAFWGADVRVYYPLGSAEAALYNATPLHYVRWPGGAVADGLNVTTNLITADGGNTSSPGSSLAEFATWCKWVGCHAIVQLPGEINQPQVAAAEVAYAEHTLGFKPNYWEIGNEPAQWTHFGIPWSNWNTSQSQNASPGSYAQVVQAYSKAMRVVDPAIHLIGLSGVGTGGYNEAVWIRATVALNGPNLSAVAIHVYPAGGTTANGTLTNFLNTLTGHGSLAYRAPIARAAIAAGCPTCRGIGLFVTEFGTGTQGGPYDKWMGSSSAAPYLAAEVAQAMLAGVSNLDLFAFQSTYNGSLLNGSGVPSRTFTMYSSLFAQLQPVLLNVSVPGAPSRVYVVAGASTNWTTYSLLVVNANTTHPLRLNLLGSGFPLLGSGSVTTWNYSAAAPGVTSFSLMAPWVWTVPARSMMVLQITV